MPASRVQTQQPGKRTKNFHEVSLGYNRKVAESEARRCPQCSDPVCIKGCPLGIDIPGFIRLLREGNINDAYEKIRKNNLFSSICGRICSAPCEKECILNKERSPIGIRSLERYVSDFGKEKARIVEKRNSGKKIAVIGSGPAGLIAAGDLAIKGYSVTIYEALDKPGGVMRYGVPEFRIPKKMLDAEIKKIVDLGVEIRTKMFVGQTVSFSELKEQGFNAVLIAAGAGVPKFIDIQGTSLGGVYYGEEFLMRVNLTKSGVFNRHVSTFDIGQKVAIIGSGNTALDCARAAVRFGREVVLIFRRTEEEMRVRSEERIFGKEEGIVFEPMVKPVEITSDGNDYANGIKCIRMDFAESDEKEGWELMPVPDSEFMIDADTVIIAIGHQPNSSVQKLGLPFKFKKDGSLKVNYKDSMTSEEGVFAAGNIVTNARPLIEALHAGRTAAEHIDDYLSGK